MVAPWDDEKLMARMSAKIVRGAEGCWDWVGATVRGRACIRYRGSSMSAPRLSKVITDKAWPAEGMFACHSCDNPRCMNPAHIWWGTNQDNIRDAAEKGRLAQQQKTNCQNGHPLSGENLRLSSKGHRICRTCAAERQRRWRLAHSASIAIAKEKIHEH